MELALIALVLLAVASGARGGAAAGGPGAPTGGPVVTVPSPTTQTAPSELDLYIDQLYAKQLAELPALKVFWNKDKLRQATIGASNFYGIPPNIVWGVMFRESGHKPVGIFGASPAKAKEKRSTAYGMGQILSNRFNSEKKLHPGRFPWTHADLLGPKVSIWSIAASYRRGQDKHGSPLDQAGNVRQWVGDWWAGKNRGDRKRGDVQKYGPDVFTIDDPVALAAATADGLIYQPPAAVVV